MLFKNDNHEKTILIIAVIVLSCRMTYEITRKPTPAELAEPGVLAKVTGVEYPPLEFGEYWQVNGGNDWKTYFWLSADYCDTTRLDVLYASIDSTIAAGDTLWHKVDNRHYLYNSHWMDIDADDNGLVPPIGIRYV